MAMPMLHRNPVIATRVVIFNFAAQVFGRDAG